MSTPKEGAQKPGDEEDLSSMVSAGAEAAEEEELEEAADRGDALSEEKAEKDEKDEPEKDEKDEPEKDEPEKDEPEKDEKDEPEKDEKDEPEKAEKDEKDEPEEAEKREKFIPRQRFDEVNAKRKQSDQRVRELEAKLAEKDKPAAESAPEFDFDGKEKAYMEAMLDGDADKATGLRKEIRSAEHAMYEKTAEAKANAVRKQVPQDVELSAVVSELEASYPVLDKSSEDFDPDITDEALALAHTYAQRGDKPAAALRKAVEKVAKANDLQSTRVAKDEPAPKKKDEPKKPEPTAEQRKKKLAEAEKQPKEGAPKGREEPNSTVEEMPDEEFDALPESKKRQLRGDNV